MPGAKSSPNSKPKAMYEELGCVIMASGLGRRFGGNKLMADFHGKPMIDRILTATQGIFARRVVVTRHEDVAAHCRCLGIDFLLHALPQRSDVVRLGLEAIASSDLKGCMFCPCDQPLLRRNSILNLCAAFTCAPARIHQLGWAGECATPVLFPRDCFAALMNLPEGKGGSFLLKAQPERISYVEAQSPWEIRDVDYPEDLHALLHAEAEL